MIRFALCGLLLLALAGCGIPASSWASAGVSIVGNIVVDVFDVAKDLKQMRAAQAGPDPPPDPAPWREPRP